MFPDKLAGAFPTDSLYKFIAIFGMLLVALPFFIYPSLNETEKNYITMTAQTQMMSVDLGLISSDLDRNNAESDDISKQLRELESTVYTKKTYDLLSREERDFFEKVIKSANDRLRVLGERHDQLQSKVRESQKLLIEKDAESKKTNIDVEYNARLEKMLPWVSGIGGGLVFVGFYLWYIKLQRYIDIEISKPKKVTNRSVSGTRKRRLTKFST